jgi:hypothetical protein
MITPTPLKPNKLAPGFSLKNTQGETVTRSQFRNKAGLLLLFVPHADDPALAPLLSAIYKDTAWYQKLKVRVILIARHPMASHLEVLDDSEGVAWLAYTGLVEAGYGVFVLDKYGGVDTQIVIDNLTSLPDAETLREYVQATMYKCNI